MKKNILLLCALLVAVGLLAGFYLWNKPHRDMQRANADFRMEAEALFVAFESDEMKANELYLDKIIAVTGEVAEVSAEQSTVVLSAEGSLFGVRCEWDANGKTHFPEFEIGDRVTLKGTCSGFLGDVVLSRCVFSE
jgi:hypothetical protein